MTDPAAKPPEQPGSLLSEWMTRDELAAEFGISPGTLSNWASARTGPPFVKLGGRVLYRREAAREWLRAQERTRHR